MSHYAGNAIIAKCKSLYGNRLKPDNYEDLLRLNTVPEIVTYLQKQDKYSNTLKDIYPENMHRGQLEDLIKKSYFGNLAKMVKFVSTKDKKFYELDMIRREIEIVLSSLRAVISGSIESSIRDLPLFFIQHASFDIGKISKSLTMSSLLKVLTGTRYYDIVERYYAENPADIRYSDLEQALLNQYHDIVIERINHYYKGKNQRNLMNIYQSKVEIDNIVKIYRLRKFYGASETEIMKTLITRNIRMSKQKLEDLINIENIDDILGVLSKSQFSEFRDMDDYVFIEYQTGKIKYNLSKRFMYFSTVPPIVYSAFLFLNEIERGNIFNIIEGVRYDIDKEDIKRMLIY